jgi:hypothetical protein
MMTSRTFLPTRDNCAGILRIQRRILEAANLMQERVHYLLFVCLFNDAVFPTLSYKTFKENDMVFQTVVRKFCFTKGRFYSKVLSWYF